MARPHIEPFVDRTVPFKKLTLPGFPKGMQYKMLSMDSDTGACSMSVLFEPGYKQPPGMSYSEYEGFPPPLTNGGLNEHGVAARDVWSDSRPELVEMTPRPQRGVSYSDLSRIVLERASSAREAASR